MGSDRRHLKPTPTCSTAGPSLAPGSPGGTANWQIATQALGPSTGDDARAALNRQPEIIAFLSGLFGKYPFDQAGGIVDNDPGIGFALENQTRPIYAQSWFDESDDVSVVVHELAHQWTGDSLAISAWRHIWLNEGFASYTEWLWAEREGVATAQEIFDSYASTPADDPFWDLTIGDPGRDRIFDGAVYDRGAMTLHALRTRIGDDDFFALLKRWTSSQAGGHVSTAEFHALAERVSGEDRDQFFRTWLFTAAKPAGIEPATPVQARKAAAAAAKRPVPPDVRR